MSSTYDTIQAGNANFMAAFQGGDAEVETASAAYPFHIIFLK